MCSALIGRFYAAQNSSTRRQVWVLVALVALDTLLKVLAFHALSADKPIHDCFVCVILRVNAVNLGSAAQSLAASQGLRPMVAGSVFSAVLAFALLVSAVKWPLTRRALAISVTSALLSCVVFLAMFPSVGRTIDPSTVAAARGGVVSLWLAIWILATSPLWKLGALLWAAAGVSNLLSSAYPPYHVVDYLWSNPLNRLLGLGVFNLADVFLLLGFIAFAAALPISVARRFGLGRRESSAM